MCPAARPGGSPWTSSAAGYAAAGPHHLPPLLGGNGDSQALAPFCPAPLDDRPATCCPHACTEAMTPLSSNAARLIGSFHDASTPCLAFSKAPVRRKSERNHPSRTLSTHSKDLAWMDGLASTGLARLGRRHPTALSKTARRTTTTSVVRFPSEGRATPIPPPAARSGQSKTPMLSVTLQCSVDCRRLLQLQPIPTHEEKDVRP